MNNININEEINKENKDNKNTVNKDNEVNPQGEQLGFDRESINSDYSIDFQIKNGPIRNSLNGKDKDENEYDKDDTNSNINNTFQSIDPSEKENDEENKEDNKKEKKNNKKEKNNKKDEKKNKKDEKKEDEKKEDEKKEDENNSILISEVDQSNFEKELPEPEIEKNPKVDNKVENKKKNLERRNSKYSEISLIPQNKNAYYDKDSDICSINSNLIDDASKFDVSQNFHSNPPKKNNNAITQKSYLNIIDSNNNDNNNNNNNNNLDKNNNNKNKNKNNEIYQSKIKDKLSENQSATSKPLNKKYQPSNKEENQNKDYRYGAIGEFLQKKFMKGKITDELFKKNDELLTLEEFNDKYKTFPLIYLADLKKHHLIYFTFLACKDNNNLFLKLSYFSLTVNLYFGLNTILIFNSNMSDAYYDKKKAKPLYIIMNLFLPFIICGIISFVIKILIMPSYCINKMVRKIQNNENLKKCLNNGENIKPEEIIVENKKGRRGRDIKNNRGDKSKNAQTNIYSDKFLDEKDKLEKEFGSIYEFYVKKVMIYFISSFIVLGINWYMMTSFCAIFKNTGVKLIVNSFISLFASFILPFIFGLIPSGLGYLSIKFKNKIIYRIYKFINIIL